MENKKLEVGRLSQDIDLDTLNDAQLGVLDAGLAMFNGNVNELCVAICKLHDNKNINSILNAQKNGSHQVTEIFDIKTIQERHEKLSSGERSAKAVLNKFNFKVDTGHRQLMPATKGLIKGLVLLKENYPNCMEFLDYIEQFALLSLCREKTGQMYFPPVLLAGPPGVGKTAIVREVAKLLGVAFKQIDMATVTSGFVLSGSSTAWSDAKAGCIVDLLREGIAANPIIILDELDKSSVDAKFNPLGGLYTLLEKEAAEQFIDEALNIPINASHILYTATANNLDCIPAPLLSRFMVINIDDVKGEHHKVVSQSIYRSVLKKESMESAFINYLSDDVCLALEPFSPREVKKKLLRAMAKTAYRQQKIKSLSMDVCDLDLAVSEEKRMGFVW